jgi:adenylate cyclase
MPSIVITSGHDSGTSFLLSEGENFVGRNPECRVRLSDPWISRLHAKVVADGEAYRLIDLDSHNGTSVNGDRIARKKLSHGDSLMFGRTSAKFLEDELDGVTRDVSDSLLKAQDTVLRNIRLLQAELASPQPDQVNGMPSPVIVNPVRRHLRVLNEIGKVLTHRFDLDTVLKVIIDLVIVYSGAWRGYLFLLDEDGALKPKIRRQRNSEQEPSVEVSKTIINTAMNDRVAILTVNAQEDMRFRESKSIIAHAITSCICVPLWLEDRVFGVIVLDSNMLEHTFAEEDLDICTAVGYQIALAIEEYRLREMIREEEEKRRALLRHFSPDVASMLMSSAELDKDPLEVGLREVTVLFADIQGFTSKSESLSPMEMANLLNGYFKLMAEAIFKEDGTLDKFIGDGVMAIFGAPYFHDDDPERTVRCALRMYHYLKAYNETLPEGMKLKIRIGINTGMVVAGNFGSLQRMEYSVLGDGVNVAARLQGLAEPGTILIGKDTFDKVRGKFFFRPLGTKPVKGKAREIEVFEVLQSLPEDRTGILQ